MAANIIARARILISSSPAIRLAQQFDTAQVEMIISLVLQVMVVVRALGDIDISVNYEFVGFALAPCKIRRIESFHALFHEMLTVLYSSLLA
jgi:hypothetical protein